MDAEELSVSKGENLELVEEDSGDGWTKVKNEHGVEGIVPTSHIRHVP